MRVEEERDREGGISDRFKRSAVSGHEFSGTVTRSLRSPFGLREFLSNPIALPESQ